MVTLVALTFSCNESVPVVNSPEELHAFVNDPTNGLKKEKEIGSVELTLSSRPNDLVVQQFLRGDKSANIDSLRNRLNQYLYFVLDISNEGKDVLSSQRGSASYMETLSNISFNLRKYIYLKSGKSESELIDFNFPRLYGMSTSTSVLLVFKAQEIKEEEFEIVVDDLGLGIGRQRFQFDQKDIKNTPKLDFATQTIAAR